LDASAQRFAGGLLSPGYYHLATQEAYIQINDLVHKRGKPGIFRKVDKEERKLYRLIKDLLHNRLTTDEPDDVHAQQLKILRMKSAGGTAPPLERRPIYPLLPPSSSWVRRRLGRCNSRSKAHTPDTIVHRTR
jgi:hypothetical protein